MVLMALLVQPGVANAQQPAQQEEVKEERPVVVVVNPGDTLWSISQQSLHPNATPQEIMNEMGRIYQLNRSQIGDNPNLLLAGQQLSLSPLAAEPTAATAPPTAATTPPTTAPTMAEPATTTVAEPIAAVAERASAAGPVEEKPTNTTLPDMPEVELIAVNSSVGAEPSLLESYAGIQRRTLGLGIIALTIILAILMAWRLPLNRPVGGSGLWGTPSGYGYSENYAALLSRDQESTPGGTSLTNDHDDDVDDERHSDAEEESNQELPAQEGEDDEPPVGPNLRVVVSSEPGSSEEHRNAG